MDVESWHFGDRRIWTTPAPPALSGNHDSQRFALICRSYSGVNALHPPAAYRHGRRRLEIPATLARCGLQEAPRWRATRHQHQWKHWHVQPAAAESSETALVMRLTAKRMWNAELKKKKKKGKRKTALLFALNLTSVNAESQIMLCMLKQRWVMLFELIMGALFSDRLLTGMRFWLS